MYFFYIDESGNSGIRLHPAEPVHWLVAVAVHAPRLRALETEMFELAVRFFGRRALDAEFEFHGADLFSGRRECNALAPRARVELYRTLAAMLSRHGCVVFVRGIEKTAYLAHAPDRGAAHPHVVAFMRMLECINGWLARRQRAEGLVPPGGPAVGLLVADEQREVDRETVRSFTSWRNRTSGNIAGPGEIRLLVDTVHYIPSKDSWLLQLADCVSYLRNRYEKVMRSRVIPGQALAPADLEIVHLWETFCAPAVADDEIWP